MPSSRAIDRWALTALAIWAVGIGLCLSFWPGIMIWDSGRQYGQALSGRFDDWHPPLMEWIWRHFIPAMPGPGSMLILQLAFYGAGLGALAARTWCRGQSRQAICLAATGLFPPTLLLMATVIKDSLMAAMLMAAFALLCHFRDSGNRLSRLGGIVLVLIASCLRFNAFLAGVPLLLLAAPPVWTVGRTRLALVIAATALLLLSAMPLANRLLGAERSGVELSLVIFDLGGITAHGGGDAFPSLTVHDPIAVNQRCYRAEKWDPYAWWGADPCLIQFADVRAAFATRHANPELFWVQTILAHPLAYAVHRLAHGNIAGAFLMRAVPERWIVSASDPNAWGFHVAPNAANRTIVRAVWAVNATPPGWPCWWLALSFSLLLLGRRLPQAGPMLALAGSAFLYSLGYCVVSVASELRYYAWPMMAALVAMVMFAGLWRATPAVLRPGRMQQALAVAPLILVTILGLGWRWL